MNESPDSSTIGKSAWQSQTLEAPTISLAFVHHQIDKLKADIRRETLLVYAAAAACAGAALFALLNPSAALSVPMGYVYRVGMALAVLGAVGVALQMRRRTAVLARPDDSVQQSLQAYRGDLERRRDYYLESWRWSLWPMLPAILVLVIGGALYDQRPQAMLHYCLMALFVVAGTALAVLDHRRKGRVFQRELDALGTLQRPQ